MTPEANVACACFKTYIPVCLLHDLLDDNDLSVLFISTHIK